MLQTNITKDVKNAHSGPGDVANAKAPGADR
jgi:hypothetical protein